ncbi:MAG: hypothetical protein Q8J74_04585 [Candidatus Didemnitutus sp.]|nr:hypothetical protein [Candidatus Didemnitutus sp.]
MKKTIFILSLASFALAVTSANAAVQNQSHQTLRLPTYTVEVARYTEAEKSINTSLNELRATASDHPALQVRAALPSLGPTPAPAQSESHRSVAGQSETTSKARS